MRHRPTILTCVCMLLLHVPTWANDPGPAPEPALLLDGAYPIEVGVSFPAALLHWLDSLAGLQGPGMTAGKTVPAHREEYSRRFGRLTENELSILREFAEARWSVTGRTPVERRNALSVAFFEAPDLERALSASEELLNDEEFAAIDEATRYFASRYRRIWNEGAVPRKFLKRASRDRHRKRLAKFMIQMARFFEVPADQKPHPRVVLVPVPRGHGTHAQAIDRHLLIELRDWEGLTDEVSPLVHENAHFLFYRIAPQRRKTMEQFAVSLDERGGEAWHLLHEALPTALGQGVAGERFHDQSWSRDQRWYHTETIDAYAKRLYPLVRKTLNDGGRFDEVFLRRAIEIYLEMPTPRSP